MLVATILFSSALMGEPPMIRHYQLGMDTLNGGGVTYGRPTYRVPRPRIGWATPWPQSGPEGHLSPPGWNARWESWNRPGYFGGEATYHGWDAPHPR